MTDTPLEYCRSCDHTHVLGTACWFASDATVDPPAPPDPLRWQPIESLDLPDTGFPDFAIVAWRGSDGMWDVGEAFHDGAWFSCFGNTRIEPVYGMPLPPAPSEAAIEAVRAPRQQEAVRPVGCPQACYDGVPEAFHLNITRAFFAGLKAEPASPSPPGAQPLDLALKYAIALMQNRLPLEASANRPLVMQHISELASLRADRERGRTHQEPKT